MQNWSSDIILDTSIRYDYDSVWFWNEIVKDFIEFLLVVVATTYYNDKWSHKRVNLKGRYNVGSSQENSTRSLFLIRVLFIQSPHGPCY